MITNEEKGNSFQNWRVRDVDLQKLEFQNGDLKITLRCGAVECIVSIDSPLSFRWIDEGDGLAIANSLGPNWIGNSVLITMEPSEYSEWFEVQTLGIKKSDQLKCTLILTANDIIEVITETDSAVLIY